MVVKKNRKIILKEVSRYIDYLIKNKINVKSAYLFGSYAQNSADEWSDIDLAIITDKFQGDSIDFKFLLTKLARSIDPNIEPHPALAEEFNLTNPFAFQILKYGEKVY